ncbi:hypothetical protein LTR85_010085 [Meristemomyces frigidus]|nr:hypothetical protein LTR85_010085 [Meristemomyces frigidus]
MASNKSLQDLSGKWKMNKELSSDVTPVLAIQGFGALVRKAASMAPVNLFVRQNGDSEIYIDQSTTANIPAIKEEWYPRDHEWRENKDSFLGKVKSRSRWAKVSELSGAEGLLTEGVDGDAEVIESEVESVENGWRAVQVWLFEEGTFVRRVVTTKGEQKAETKLVYNFQG